MIYLLLAAAALAALATRGGGRGGAPGEPSRDAGPAPAREAERARRAAQAASRASSRAATIAQAERAKSDAQMIAELVAALQSQNPPAMLALAAELESRGYQAQAGDLRAVANTISGMGQDFELFEVPDWAKADVDMGLQIVSDETDVPIGGWIDAAEEIGGTGEQFADTLSSFVPSSSAATEYPPVWVEVPPAETPEGQIQERIALLERLKQLQSSEASLAEAVRRYAGSQRVRGWLVDGAQIVGGEFAKP